MLQVERPWMLAVEDPKDPSNDLGKGSYNIQKVRAPSRDSLARFDAFWPGCESIGV